MLIGTLQIEVYLPATFSLKEKRFVLQSIKKRLRNRYNISVAEVDFLDKWQRTCLGIACVSNERKFIDQTFNQIMKSLEDDNRIQIIDHLVEVL